MRIRNQPARPRADAAHVLGKPEDLGVAASRGSRQAEHGHGHEPACVIYHPAL